MNQPASAASPEMPVATDTDWPTLTSMGVMRPHEISRYTLRQDGNADVLRVHYKRAGGSLLPVTRRYHFGRSLQTSVADSGTARMERTYEVSPYLMAAIDELDAVVALNKLDTGEPIALTEDKRELLGELESLRKLTVRQLAPADAGTLSVQFEQIARRIEAL